MLQTSKCFTRVMVLVVVFGLLPLSVLFAQQPPQSETTAPKPARTNKPDSSQMKFYTLDEIKTIMENSSLLYDYRSKDDSFFINVNKSEPLELKPMLHVVTEKGRRKLVPYNRTAMTDTLIGMVSKSNMANNYREALRSSKEILQKDSTFNYARTMIGDSYYLLGEYDSAIAWFKKSIKNNYSDFVAHWYLADAYLRKNDTVNSLRELTIAHILNYNSADIRKSLVTFRGYLKKPFDQTVINPKFEIKKVADTITVRYPEQWEGYALATAVWKYEPGYKEKHLKIDPDSTIFSIWEAGEAMLCQAAIDTALFSKIDRVTQAGYFQEFLIYELAAKDHPEWVASMPGLVINRLAEYVTKFR